MPNDKFYFSVWLRSKGDSAVGLVPKWVLRNFLKSFNARPDIAEAVGFHVHPSRYDSPLPLMHEIDRAKHSQPRLLPDIDLRVPAALELVSKIRPYVSELDTIPYQRDGKAPFWFDNLSFTDFDAAVLYAMLRHLKPKRYVELGCGFSSLVSSMALQRNHQEGNPSDVVYGDPDPRLPMGGTLPYGRFIKQRVQDLPLQTFTALQPGDVLFIDTSHVLKIQSDVEHELLRILPSLAPGVWIHIHDIFTPYDYPEDWIWRPLRLGLNEQYAVECLLSGGHRYQIEIALHHLVRDHLPAMQQFFPRGRTRAHSLWLRKVECP